MRLYDPQKGKILIDGVSIKEYSLKSIYKNIGVIFQDFIKYPLTARENIGIGNVEEMNKLKDIEKAAKVSGADDFIEKLKNGYDTLLQKEWDNGSELSIGQWQKIAISRAVLRNSGILILDEPSSALDPKSESEMFEKMKMLMKDKMSIMITHRFSNVRIVDQIFVMQEGKIVEFGSYEDLMLKKGIYYNLYSLQADYYK